jgi:hypothetical protein
MTRIDGGHLKPSASIVRFRQRCRYVERDERFCASCAPRRRCVGMTGATGAIIQKSM